MDKGIDVEALLRIQKGPQRGNPMRAVLAALVAMAALLMAMSPAQAQVQRSFINLGFELPDMVNANCVSQVSSAIVPGWETTHPSGTGFGCGAVTNPPASNVTGPLIELWSTPFNGVSARSGDQFAELNANVASRIYQNVCLVNGETVSWRFSHRGRNSATVDDVAEFNINSSANTVVRARTQNDGGTGYTAADCTVNDGSVTSGTCVAPVQSGTWRDYSGQFVWMGGSAVQSVGFEAISSAGGVVSVGNFIDDIQIALQPYVEFELSSFTVPEQGTPSVQLKVLGVVPAGGITVPITAAGGTATSGTDFTVGSVTIPAGDYGAGQLFTVPLTITNDTVIENNETIVLSIGSGSGYVIASTSTCGAAAIVTSTGTIIDNDVDLLTTKTASTTTPLFGTPFTYTVTYRNNTAAPTVAPLTAHDVTAAISDPVPAGLTFTTWTCQASNGATCPGGTVNGSVNGNGAISGNAIFPAGSAAAGGLLTYTITATLSAPTCAAITNTSTIATPSGFTEGTSVQSGFISPASGGTGNNTANVVVTPSCAAVQLNKIWVGATPGEAVTLGISGPAVTSIVNGSSSAPATTVPATAQATPGSVVTLAETFAVPANAGSYTSSLGCTRVSDGAPVTVSGSGLSRTINMPANSGVNCAYTNTKQGSITIIKDAVPNDAQDFAFTTTGTGLSGFSLDDDADATLSNTRTFSNLTPGSYSVTEGLLAGWNLSNLVCVDPDNGSTVNLGTRVATIDLDAGENITCTFTNQLSTDLSITKTNTPGVNGDVDQAADTVTSGSPTTYTIKVVNNGPATVTGAVVKDTVVSGLVCPTGNVVTCTGTGCPAGPITVASVQSGLTLGTLTATAPGNTVSLVFSCNVP